MLRMIPAAVVVMFICGVSWAQDAAGQSTAEPRIEYKLSNVVAKVNRHVITEDELCGRMFRIHGPEILGQMISELLIEDEAEAMDIQIKDKDLDARVSELAAGFSSPEEFDGWLASQRLTREEVRDQVRLGMLQEQAVTASKQITVSPEEVDEFFEANKAELGTPELFHLRHILVPTEEEIQDVVIALQAGADFAKLAGLKSHDPATRERGGDLGFVPLSALAPTLHEAVAGLSPGEVSPVVASDGGFHVIMLEETKAAVPAVLDKKTRSDLEAFLRKAKVDAAMPGFMQELHAKAEVSLSGVAAAQ